MNRYLSFACSGKGVATDCGKRASTVCGKRASTVCGKRVSTVCGKRVPTLLALGFVLLTAACATEPANQQETAAAAASTSANPVVAAVDPSQERECRSVKVTGTNFPKRVCESKAYWNAKARAERRISDEFGRQASENSAVVQPGSTLPGFVPTTP
jgi:hypothetical protein